MDPRFLAEPAGDPPLTPRVLVRLAPQPVVTPPLPVTIGPCPLSEPDGRISRIRLPATTYQSSGPEACLPRTHRGSVPVYGRCHVRHAVMASPPSLHPSYQASSVLRSDPTSTPPFALLASSARAGILPAEEQRGSPWLSPRHDAKREPASDPGPPRDTRRTRDAGCCLQRWRALGRDPTVTTFRGSIPSRSGCRPSPLVLASLSCLRINPSVAVWAARLDTGPVASRYPGGSSPACRGDLARSLPPTAC